MNINGMPLLRGWCCMQTDALLKGMAGGFCIRDSRRCCDKWSTYKPGSQRLLQWSMQVPSVCRLFCHGLESLCSLHVSQLISGTRVFTKLCSTLAVPNTWNILLKESDKKEGEMKGKPFSQTTTLWCCTLPWISHDFRKVFTRSLLAK